MYVAQYTGNGVLPAVYKISNELVQQWGIVYTLDPAKVSTAADAYGESYFLLNSGETTIDFLAWQWSVGQTFPIRIYRYRISKGDGSVINVAALDFTTPGSTNASYITIKDVKIDSENNYYFIGVFPVNSEILPYSICKFTEDLTFVWAKAIQTTVYRNQVPCTPRPLQDGNLFISLTVGDEGIIGCIGFNNLQDVAPTYFSFTPAGATLSAFTTKFSTSNFSSDLNPFLTRSVCRDDEGNIYGFGGYNTSLALGSFNTPIIVFKDSPSDVTIWAKNIRDTFYPGRGTLIGQGNQLIVVSNKLVLVAPWEISGSSTEYQLLVCVFNLDTGAIERSLDFRAPQPVRYPAIVQALPEEGKFIVQTDSGYRIRLDVNNLPASGNYPSTDNPSRIYTINDASTTTVDSTFYRFSCPTNPGFVDRNIGAYFTSVTPVVTVSGSPSASFEDFAGQDTP